MPLQNELDAFRASWELRVGEAIAALIVGDIEGLRSSGILDSAAKRGDLWPLTHHLVDALGQPFDLDALIRQKPVVLTVYRGGWCPYCNLELRAFQAQLVRIHELGAELVALSPETPDHSLTTAQKNDLAFPVLSDVGGALAAKLGIRFPLSEAVKPFYEKAGHALPLRNGDGEWALPMPATFVIGQGGRIAAAFIEPDYRKRLDPREAIIALQNIVQANAA
ncbi:peroxiredoxin-like family protein [Rhabdaerophilum sp. SD176]|uniref:peroxiredoxin-like family protein n=1 Tax=Rhabdaerophilum sp. SD176 TaxID=2983548 RepID=UPI0024DF4DA3|nr:peroxiredoxin-like family protein [Rhabdaerophilum sp. SD176]